MRIAIAADHAGYYLKEKLKDYLRQEGYQLIDVGAYSFDQSDDYPDFAASAASKVSEGEADRAILICDSGIGVDIVANKFPGVRSALVNDEELAKLTRQHNDTNALALASMYLDESKARRIVRNWLDTPFSNADRHARRLRKIREIEDLERLEALEVEVCDD